MNFRSTYLKARFVHSTLAFLLVATLTSDTWSQQPILAEGAIPADFLDKASVKARAGIEREKAIDEGVRANKAKSEFILKSNFLLDDLLTSGSVIFGDEVTEYVNDVARQVLDANQRTGENLRFYVIKSNMANAFSTHQGMIFITTGLLARLQTEAQLAFILAHEIAHYDERHVINSIVEADRSYSSRERRTEQPLDETIKKLSMYSRGLEMEADSLGLLMLINAGYNLEASIQSFDVLQRSHLPFIDSEIDFNRFLPDSVVLAEKFWLDSVPEPKSSDELYFDEEYATHPALEERTKLTQGQIASHNGDTGKDYFLPEERFENMRERVGRETMRLCLSEHDYTTALYLGLAGAEDHPDDRFYDEQIFKALYGVAMFRLTGNYFQIKEQPSSLGGQWSRVQHFLNNCNQADIYALAVSEGWKLYQRNPSTHNLLRIKSLTKELTREDNALVPGVEAFVNLIRLEDEVVELVEESDSTHTDTTHLSLFQPLLDDLDNLADLDRVNQQVIKDLEREKTLFTPDFEFFADSALISRDDKIVVMDPDFLRIDERKGVRLLNSEVDKLELFRSLTDVGFAADVHLQVVSPKFLSEDETHFYNSLSVANQYARELMNVREFVGPSFVPSVSEYIDLVKKNFDAHHIMYTGVYSMKMKKQYNFNTFFYATLMGIAIPPLLPVTLYYLFRPQQYSYFYYTIIDVNTHNVLVNNGYEFYQKTFHSDYKSIAYDLFNLMKTDFR